MTLDRITKGLMGLVKNFTKQDLREVPAYSIAEAAGYLRLPKSTLRAWMVGQQTSATDAALLPFCS